MDNNDTKTNDPERSVIELLQEISSGLLDPKLLDASSRQRCTQALKDEGRTLPQIANFLHCSERTVRRDWKALKDQNAITADTEFSKQTIGELNRQATIHISYLMRIARDKGTTTAEKIQAEFAAWRVLKEYVEKLQTTGYLPLKPTAFVGNFYHNEEPEKSPEEMRKTISSLEEMAKEAGALDKEAMTQIEDLRKRVEQSEITVDIKKLEETILNKEEDHAKEN